jgi:hypothetical protein
MGEVGWAWVSEQRSGMSGVSILDDGGGLIRNVVVVGFW